MTYSFNLIDQPWIPCIDLDGQYMEFGIGQTLAEAGQLRELRGETPVETAAMYRLLLAILHRVYGPKNRSVWLALWRNRKLGLDRDHLDNYLHKWYDRFDLFDTQHPFFQVSDEQQLGKPGTLNKMISHLTADSTLFEHTLDDGERGVVLTFAQAARVLVTLQNYGLGYKQFVDAPCAKGLVFLIQGANLLETLLLNLTRYPEESGDYASSEGDSPAWEQDSVFSVTLDGTVYSRDAVQVTARNEKQELQYGNQTPLGQLDYLTWHNRKIKLFPETVDEDYVVRKAAWAPGMRLEKDVLDPMQFFDKSDDGWQRLGLRLGRSLWRDLDVLLRLPGSSGGIRPIRALDWISRSMKDEADLCNKLYILSAFGMAKTQAKVLYLRHETTPLPSALLSSDSRDILLGYLSTLLQAAEAVCTEVNRAAFVFAWHLLSPRTLPNYFDNSELVDAKLRSGAWDQTRDEEAKRAYGLYASWATELTYWATLECSFHRMIAGLPSNPEQSSDEWRQEIRRCATITFKQVISNAGSDLRAHRAAALASQTFNRGLAAALGKADHSDLSSQEGTEDETT